MTKRRIVPWYQQAPSLIIGGLTAAGLLGGVIVKLAGWLTLPDTVQAMVQKNEDQDRLLERLTIIQEQNQALLQVQQSLLRAQTGELLPSDPVIRWEGPDGSAWCCAMEEAQACTAQQAWRPCEPEP